MKCCAIIKPLPDSAFFSLALPMAIGLGTDSRLLSQLQGMATELQILNDYPLGRIWNNQSAV